MDYYDNEPEIDMDMDYHEPEFFNLFLSVSFPESLRRLVLNFLFFIYLNHFNKCYILSKRMWCFLYTKYVMPEKEKLNWCVIGNTLFRFLYF